MGFQESKSSATQINAFQTARMNTFAHFFVLQSSLEHVGRTQHWHCYVALDLCTCNRFTSDWHRRTSL